MWALPTNKKAFLDLFDGENTEPIITGSEISVDFLSKNLSDELLLLWPRKPAKGELPIAIVVPDNRSREFIAWATTAIGGYRPFTAFFKVMNQTQAEKAFGAREPVLNKFEGPLIGLIVGEALTQSPDGQSLQNLSLLPCKSTYSYSLSRAYALGYFSTASQENPIANAWALSRKLTRQPTRKLADEFVELAFNVILNLEENSNAARPGVPQFVIDVCRELFFQGKVEKSWRLLEEQIPSLDEIASKMKGPREKRVRAFENVLMDSTGLEPISTSFLAGLLGSQIGQGTFEHVDLLTPYLTELPMALLWYGICVGLHRENEVQESADCLGRRLVRDLLFSDPVLSPPKYDISVGELEVCLDREEPLNFRVASPSHIAVEIAPGVPAIMKWPVSATSTTDEPRPVAAKYPTKSQTMERQASLFAESHEKDLFREGEIAMLELEKVVGRIKGVFDELSKRKDDSKQKNSKGRKQPRSKRR